MVERLVISAKGRAGFLSDFFLPAQRIILTAAIFIRFNRAIQHGSHPDTMLDVQIAGPLRHVLSAARS